MTTDVRVTRQREIPPGPVELCVDAARGPDGLVMLAYCADTIPAFTVDTFGTHPSAALAAATLVSRNTSFLMHQADRQLAEARTGRLVRLLVVAERGAVHVDQVVEGQDLIAVSIAVPDRGPVFAQIRSGDRRAAVVANGLRGLVSQRPMDYGGWLAVGGRETPPGEPRTGGAAVEVTADRADVADRCRAVLSRGDVHYLAVYRDGRLTATGNVLGDPALRRFLMGRSAADLLTFYAGFGTRVDTLVKELAMAVHTVIGRRVEHVSFDVERGAVCYRWVDPETYVVTVTLDQDLVSRAESSTGELAASLAGR